MQGVIKLHRKLLNNSIWNRKPFSPGQAWIDLLLLASFKDSTVPEPTYGKTQVSLKVGELVTTERILSDRWGWKRGKVRNHLYAMVSNQMITMEKCTLYTLISIVYYDQYQRQLNGNVTTLVTSKEPESNQVSSESLTGQGITSPKKLKKLRSNTVRSDVLFWKLVSIYPKGMNKSVSQKAWNKLDPSDALAAEIISHVARRNERDKQWVKNNGQFVPMLSTFLNNRRWEDNYEENASTTDNRPLEV